MKWARDALDCLRAGQPCALISILAVEGSTPREAGTRMVVTATGILGTIGGGNLEFQCIDQARLILAHPPGTWRVQDYPLGVLLGQCCGGRVRVLIERLDPNDTIWLEMLGAMSEAFLRSQFADARIERRLVAGPALPLSARGAMPGLGDVIIEHLGQPILPVTMFGAGHVGQAIARLITPGLPVRLHWMDVRNDLAEAVRVGTTADLCVAARQARGAVLILTHDHGLDYELVKAALQSTASFIGVIGSATKRARFISRLRKEGISDDQIVRVICPIGIEGINGKAPEVIAIAVLAQLLQHYAQFAKRAGEGVVMVPDQTALTLEETEG